MSAEPAKAAPAPPKPAKKAPPVNRDAGKGDRPRNNASQAFRENWDVIFKKGRK